MENQHQKIRGYRDLSQEEIDLMNRIKVEAERIGAIIDEMDKMPNASPASSAQIQIDKRWMSIARTQLQQGYMSLVRSVTRPTNF